MSERKPVIKSTDMTDELQQDAVNTAIQVLAAGRPSVRRGRLARAGSAGLPCTRTDW